MKQVVCVLGDSDLNELTDALDVEDLGNAMVETKQPEIGHAPDSSMGFGRP